MNSTNPLAGGCPATISLTLLDPIITVISLMERGWFYGWPEGGERFRLLHPSGARIVVQPGGEATVVAAPALMAVVAEIAR